MLLRNLCRENTPDFPILTVLKKSGHFPNSKSEKEACFLSPCRSENQASFDLFSNLITLIFLVAFLRVFNLLNRNCHSSLFMVLRKQFKMCHCHDNLAFSPEGRKRKKVNR
jgi:hypothetical protein